MHHWATSPSTGKTVLDGQELPPNFVIGVKSIAPNPNDLQMADTALNPKVKVKEIIGRPAEFYEGLLEQNLKNGWINYWN